MKNKKIFIVIILILTIYSINESILFFRLKGNCEDVKRLIDYAKNENIKMNDNIERYLNIFYIDIDSFNVFSENLISEYNINNKVVFFFREGTCMSCILDELLSIDSILLKMIAPEKVILVYQSNEENIFENKIFKEYKERFNTIWIKSNFYFKPLEFEPYYFIANKNKLSKFLYIPNFIPSYKKKYFNEIVTANIN
jgi:hypothetical protein